MFCFVINVVGLGREVLLLVDCRLGFFMGGFFFRGWGRCVWFYGWVLIFRSYGFCFVMCLLCFFVYYARRTHTHIYKMCF